MSDLRKLTQEEIAFVETLARTPRAGRTGPRGQYNVFGSRFTAERSPIWHQMGKTVAPGLSVSEAFAAHGLDYQIGLLPTVVVLPGGDTIPTGKSAVVRGPIEGDRTTRVLGHVSDRYRFFQNMELARLLDPIAKDWPVDTVGMTAHGEIVFVVFNAGDSEVVGENYGNFFMVSDSKNGGRALSGAFIGLRFACTNAIPGMFRGSALKTSISHKLSTFRTESEFRFGFMKQLRTVQEETYTALAALARKTLVEDQINAILDAAYPDPPKPGRLLLSDAAGDLINGMDKSTQDRISEAQETYEYARERVLAFRTGARELLGRFNDSHPALANTAYAAVQVVIESADFRRGRDGTSESALWGARATEKTRAMETALSLN